MDNLERTRQVEYRLFSRALGLEVIQEPKGSSNDTRSFERDKDSKSILSKTEIKLDFYGNANDYLRHIYFNYGIEEKVTLTKYVKDLTSLSETWKIRYVQELDMGTFKEDAEQNSSTVKSTQGGLYTDIKNRYSDRYDLINDTSADGENIGELVTNTFQPLGRKLFLQSLLEDNRVNYRVNAWEQGLVQTYNTRTIPFEVTYNSDQEDVTNVFYGSEAYNDAEHTEVENNDVIGSEQRIGDQFLYRAENDKTVFIKFNLDLKIASYENINGNISPLYIELRKSELSGVDDVLKEKTTLLQISNPENEVGVNKILAYEQEITLLKGESLAIVISFIKVPSNYKMNWFFNIDSKLVIEDRTAYEDVVTVSRCIKPLDFFSRIVAKITNETDLVKSSIFEEGGEYEYMVVDNGLFARGFPNEYENSEDTIEKIQLTTSMKEAFDSFNYIEPLCWFTEFVGNKEYLRIEKATYTQQNFIAIDLGNVDGIKNTASKPDFFSEIELGHDKSLDYQEINGLDESNGKSFFSTFVKKNVAKYSVISKYRTDAIPYELTRRKPFSNFPKLDTSRDEHIWIHDAKLVGSTITHNKWSDIFDSLPIGIYDPETSWNLRLSPMNRLYYGHGYSIKRGLYHYPEKKVTFSSSNANQNLITTINGVELAESGFLLIKDIEKSRVEANKTDFTFKMTQEIETILTGTTKINGIYVPNYFGLIKYYEKNEEKYGRMVKLDSSEEAKMTLINARL